MNILVIANSNWNIFNFRLDFIKELTLENKVFVLLSNNEEQYEFNCSITPIYIEGIERNKIRISSIFRFLFETNKAINAHEIDRIYTFTFYISALVGLLQKRLSRRKYEQFSVITGFGKLFTSNSFIGKIFFHFGAFLLAESKIIFVQNLFDKRYLKRLLKNQNIQILPGSGVNMNKFDASVTPKKGIIRFCYVGRLLESKGVNMIIEAFNKFALHYNSELFIVGDYDSNDREFKLKNVAENIFLKGWTSDAVSIHQMCHASILMSDREGLSKSLLESLACRTPIIAFTAPGVVDIFNSSIEEIGIRVERRNSNSLLEKMLKFAELTESDYLSMCHNSRRIISLNYSSEIVNKKLLGL